MRLSTKLVLTTALTLSQALPCFSAVAHAAPDQWGIEEASYHGHRVKLQHPFENPGIGPQLDKWSCALNAGGQFICNNGSTLTPANYAAFRDTCPKAFSQQSDAKAMLRAVNQKLPAGVDPIPDDKIDTFGDLIIPAIDTGCTLFGQPFPLAAATPKGLARWLNGYRTQEQYNRHEKYVDTTNETLDTLISTLYGDPADGNPGQPVLLMIFNERQPIKTNPMYSSAISAVCMIWDKAGEACPDDAPNLHYIAVTGFDPDTGLFTYRTPSKNPAIHFNDQRGTVAEMKEQWLWTFAAENPYIKALFDSLDLAPGSMIAKRIVSPEENAEPLVQGHTVATAAPANASGMATIQMAPVQLSPLSNLLSSPAVTGFLNDPNGLSSLLSGFGNMRFQQPPRGNPRNNGRSIQPD